MRTLGRRIFPMRHGFVAEATASSVLYLTAFVIAAPISTTQVMTASVMGVGATRRIRAVRWALLARSGWPGYSRCPPPQRSPASRIHRRSSWRLAKGRPSAPRSAPANEPKQVSGGGG
jgi:hypothetical protein